MILWVSWSVKYCILLSKLYNTFYPENNFLDFPLPGILPYLSVPNYPQKHQEDEKNI